ncbi:MAG: Rne/Rng family ribonuclease [Alphaproteobacteria bacterium]|nr:Rne/Rng family ribonuclease [Alphaproteobacteria bacterium]
MTKRMLIDATQPEETRVVVVNGNKLEDVECETTHRRQIKGNIYLGKVMRVEPSLQACFIDYGGNKHGFMAFGEIHPDYYNLSEEELSAVDKEVDEIIENKKQAIKERELERERIRKEKAAAREAALKAKAEAQAAAEAEQKAAAETAPAEEADKTPAEAEPNTAEPNKEQEDAPAAETADAAPAAAPAEEETGDKKHRPKKRVLKKRIRKQAEAEKAEEEPLKVMTEAAGLEEEQVSAEVDESDDADEEKTSAFGSSVVEEEVDEDDDDTETDFELQRKLIRARKLFHRNKIQDVIKEGQIVLVQVVKEERGNKGAALTTYLSLAGRYCVLMPNRIKSGGVSRKITNAADRTRLKGIVKELPLTSDMSIIVRTAGEEKTKADIVRDYNYLIRTWNQIRLDSLKGKAPALIHEEGNLIKRALRDIYSKETAEILVAGEEAFKSAKDFFRILSPHNLKKIKLYRNNDMPLFQRFQVEGQLDKLHEANAQLESGGYLVINPTEALISIDVNSGRATKEKDLEETALKTNLEACDEIARQLRMRNLAGLVVIDFIDMDEPANNHAVEKRMKEALKKDRSRIQVGKMSMFGLLELSRQRMHSSFFESNYQVCPHCQGKGIVRTIESSAVYILRMIEEEGIKGRSSKVNVYVPSEIAIYLLNQKRQMLAALEQKYKMCIVISADDSIKCITEHKIERTKAVKEEAPVSETKPEPKEEKKTAPAEESADAPDEENAAEPQQDERRRGGRDRRRGRNRFDRRGRGRFDRKESSAAETAAPKEKQEAVILYNSHEDIKSDNGQADAAPTNEPAKEKSTWWKKLIKG